MKHGVWLVLGSGLWVAALIGLTACSVAQDDGDGAASEAGVGAGSSGTASAAGQGASGAGGAGVPVVTTPTSGSAGSGGGAGAAPSAGSGGAPAAGSTGAGAGGGGDAGSSGASAGSGGSPAPTPRFPSVTDLAADGPYTPVTIEASGPGGGYTVYHPEQLAPDGLKNPFLTWGNGATTVPALYVLLPHLASHGFVVIASNNAFVTGEEMRAGIDWLFEQNEDASSPFHQKLDTTAVGSFGYSLGSLGTFEIAADPRLVTTVHISGGAMDKAVVPNLKHPAAFFCGDPSDIAHANCESDFELATVPVFYGVFPGDHLGILGAFAEPINEVVTGWLRWRLMHDDSLAPMFVGPDCTLCKDAGWTVKQKDFDVAP